MVGKEIYVVYGSSGSYDDYSNWVIGVTPNLITANNLANTYNKETALIPENELPISWDKYDEFLDKYLCGDNEYMGDDGEIFFDKINDPNFTEEIYNIMKREDDKKFTEYHPAEINIRPIYFD